MKLNVRYLCKFECSLFLYGSHTWKSLTSNHQIYQYFNNLSFQSAIVDIIQFKYDYYLIPLSYTCSKIFMIIT